MSFVFYSSFVYISAYANVDSKQYCGRAFEPGYLRVFPVLRLHLCSFRLYSARYLCGFQTKKKVWRTPPRDVAVALHPTQGAWLEVSSGCATPRVYELPRRRANVYRRVLWSRCVRMCVCVPRVDNEFVFCLFVYVCVCERERQRVCVHVHVYMCPRPHLLLARTCKFMYKVYIHMSGCGWVCLCARARMCAYVCVRERQ